MKLNNMRKNYNYKLLSEMYEKLSEGAALQLKKEMFREECWDATADRPIPECWTESGDIKDECWAAGPGGTNTVDGGAVADAAMMHAPAGAPVAEAKK